MWNVAFVKITETIINISFTSLLQSREVLYAFTLVTSVEVEPPKIPTLCTSGENLSACSCVSPKSLE